MSFANTVLVFSEIIPRLLWLNSLFEKVRKRISRGIEKFLPTNIGFSFRHVDIEGSVAGLYREDGVHLSDSDLDIFNTNF